MTRRGLLSTAIAAGLVDLACPRRARAAEPRAFRRGSWREIGAEHAGRRTVVHFWGLTCGPCLVELPRWGEIFAQHPAADLVMVAADPIPQAPDALNETLARAGLAGVETWSFQDRFTERLLWEVDHAWQGELPFTVLLAADGTKAFHLGAVADTGLLERWLRT